MKVVCEEEKGGISLMLCVWGIFDVLLLLCNYLLVVFLMANFISSLFVVINSKSLTLLDILRADLSSFRLTDAVLRPIEPYYLRMLAAVKMKTISVRILQSINYSISDPSNTAAVAPVYRSIMMMTAYGKGGLC